MKLSPENARSITFAAASVSISCIVLSQLSSFQTFLVVIVLAYLGALEIGVLAKVERFETHEDMIKGVMQRANVSREIAVEALNQVLNDDNTLAANKSCLSSPVSTLSSVSTSFSPVSKKTVRSKEKDSDLYIFYGTKMGHSREMAKMLATEWMKSDMQGVVDVQDLANFEPEDLPGLSLVVIIISTWDGGLPPDSAKYFIKWLEDVSGDFRRSKRMLSLTKTAVFGLGSSAYSDDIFCTPAKEIASLFKSLGSQEVIPIGFGDDAQGDQDVDFIEWAHLFLRTLSNADTKKNSRSKSYTLNSTNQSECCNSESDETKCCKSDSSTLPSKTYTCKEEPRLSDFNYIGDRRSKAQLALLSKRAKKRLNRKVKNKDLKSTREYRRLKRAALAAVSEPIPIDEEDLVNDRNIDIVELEERDEKRRLLRVEAEAGAHNLLGLEDDLVQETGADANAKLDPSLDDHDVLAAKSNDGILDLEDIGNVMQAAKKDREAAKKGPPRSMVTPRQRQALNKEGYKIIGTHSAVKLCRWTKNQLRGRGGCYKHTCYGITSYQCMEATPSLACANKCTFCWRHHKNPVGKEWRWKTDDPYYIVDTAVKLHQQMIKQMKGVPGVKMERLTEAATVKHCALSLVGEPIIREISTFLVTNAQFPECIDKLAPVTQLYVSIDAATKDALKAVDRPLFKDFWERFISSLRALRKKKQRTVYRLTLLKEHNMKDVEQYSELIRIGQPEFIEIKAVTFCGKSDGSDLTFDSVPFHEEVLAFSKDICNYVNTLTDCCEYGVASEHQHSNLVLLAKKKYKNEEDGRWRTWIDYKKFHELVKEGKPFTADDYAELTPAWATYGAIERGMDPKEMRYYHNRTIRRAKEGKLTAQQLAQYPSNPADFEHGSMNAERNN